MKNLMELRYLFWYRFYEYTQNNENAKSFRLKFKNNPPQPSIKDSTASFYPLNSGSGKYSLYCEMLIKPFGQANLRLDIRNIPALIEKLTEHRGELEKTIGFAKNWCVCTGKSSKIIFSTQCDLTNQNDWQIQFEWYCKTALILRDFLDKYGKEGKL